MVAEIDGSYGNRYQAAQKDILRFLDIAQKAAFCHDCRAFERTAPLISFENNWYEFPKDARQIISANFPEYEIDLFGRRIYFSRQIPNPEARYYLRPQTLTGTELESGEMEFTEDDESKVIIPDEWRWQTLGQPAIAMLESGLYGDKTPQSYLESYFREFWEAMNARPNNRQPVVSLGAW